MNLNQVYQSQLFHASFFTQLPEISYLKLILRYYLLSCLCQEDTEGEIKREQTQEQRTEKDSMYELSAKNDLIILVALS